VADRRIAANPVLRPEFHNWSWPSGGNT
jgi:hypothetical protein